MHTTLSTSCPCCGRLYAPGYPAVKLDGEIRLLCCGCLRTWTVHPEVVA